MGSIGKTLAAVLALAVLLPGCLSRSPNTPARFYILDPMSVEAPLSVSGPPLSIELRSLYLPQYLEKPQLVTRSTGNRLVLDEYHQWGGNLRKNIIRVTRQNLSTLLSTPHVTAPPMAFRSGADVKVDIEIMAFEADPAGRVTLRVLWRIIKGDSGRLAHSDLSKFEQQARDTETNRDGIVEAMNQVLGMFSRTLAEDILAHAVSGGGN